jgi:D-alanyl-D-alanine carboxypeptidase (penicillin-binding protein 5/6)
MNARAAQLGLADSHFVHPCGLDAPGQHTTANDLLKVAQAALERPEIAAIVRQQAARVTTLGGRALGMHNGNHLLGSVAGVIGMKSGYTAGAGTCVIAVAERQGHRVWLVMLDAPLRWWNAAGMIEAAYRWIAFHPVDAAS